MSQGPLPETNFAFSTDAIAPGASKVVRFTTLEAMSSVYEATLVLALDTTTGSASIEGMLGAHASLAVERAGLRRLVCGIVREFEELGSTALHRFVRVTLAPSLWNLSQRSDCRIFQQMNVLAIVREVLRVAGVYQEEGALEVDATLDAMAPREYCVQYQETDLAFVQRLLEEEGIPYYFKHESEGGETLVFAGDTHAYHVVPTLDDGAIRVLDAGVGTEAVESVRWLDERHALRPTSVTVRDFDFSRPRTLLSPAYPAQPGPRSLYEFPARAALGGYDEGARTYRSENTSRLARVRHEAHQMRAHIGHGRSNVTGMMPGRVFELEGHELPEMNRAFLVTAVEQFGQAWTEIPEDVSASERVLDALTNAGVLAEREGRRGRVERYRNTLTTHRAGEIETSVPYRPERTMPRPIIEGPQTAWVVGPAGEEIYTDSHGRIKVQFHWDRLGANNERSSCWIRLAQSSSGPGWGFTVLPRIGMEVVVSFIEGDPDRPMVTGCVTNGQNGSSYTLPDAKTRSVIKTQSSPHTGGYNEIRFEDLAGLEQLFVQAERDHDTLVKNDQTVTVRRHRTKVVQGEEYNTIERNRVTRVVGDNLRQVDGNQEVEVHGASGSSLSIDQNYNVRVGEDHKTEVGKNLALSVGKNLQESVTLNSTETVGIAKALSVGATYAITVGGAMQTKVQLMQSESVGTTKSVTVGDKITITCGASVLTMDKSGDIMISGKDISVVASGSVSVNATGEVTVVSAASVHVKGPSINLN
jgi:type VI secretion system secreted protein VgrG